MQNKPNFLETKMNLNPDMTKHYEQKPPLRQAAKQTQFKPNQTQFQTRPALVGQRQADDP
jgi:hypothetical protein